MILALKWTAVQDILESHYQEVLTLLLCGKSEGQRLPLCGIAQTKLPGGLRHNKISMLDRELRASQELDQPGAQLVKLVRQRVRFVRHELELKFAATTF